MRYAAFIVHISNPLNFDIDLIGLGKKPLDAISNSYDYELPGEEKVHRSLAYRCRVKDIKLEEPHGKFSSKLYSREDCQSFRNIIRHINSLDGWVYVDVHDVDAHQRVIVDIIDPNTKENIIAKHLLKKKGSYYKYYWP